MIIDASYPLYGRYAKECNVRDVLLGGKKKRLYVSRNENILYITYTWCSCIVYVAFRIKKHSVVGCIIQTLKTILLRDPEEELMPLPGRVLIVMRITENPSTKIVVGLGGRGGAGKNSIYMIIKCRLIRICIINRFPVRFVRLPPVPRGYKDDNALRTAVDFPYKTLVVY